MSPNVPHIKLIKRLINLTDFGSQTDVKFDRQGIPPKKNLDRQVVDVFFFHELWYGGFLNWWYPTTIGFPTKNNHFGVFWAFKETPFLLENG